MARGTIVSEARSRGKKLDLEIVNCARSATCLVVLANHGIQLARREHRKKKGMRGGSFMPSRSGRSSRKSSSSRTGSASSKSRSSSHGSSRAASSRSKSARSGSSRPASANSRERGASSRSRSTASRARNTGQSGRSASSRPIVDHDEIQQWAEERGARPACVRGTGGGEDVGMIRLDFPGYSGERSLEHIEWDEWFQKFDESGLALLVQEKTARGQKSNFNKLVSRETASAGGRSSSRKKSSSGSRGSSSRRKAA